MERQKGERLPTRLFQPEYQSRRSRRAAAK
jgi:hypothetical protein